MTNASQPHRKFVQTFVLAPQARGWFLLNDILRFLVEEDDQTIDAPEDAPPAYAAPAAEEPTEQPSQVVATEEAAVQVDEKLEKVAKAEEAEPVSGQTAESEEATEPEVPTETTIAGADEIEQASEPVVETPLTEEKPVDPTPTPAESKPAPKPTAAPKPAVPLSWAQRAAASSKSAAQAAAPAAAATPTHASTKAVATPSPAPVATPTSAPTKSAAPAPATPTAVPPRQPSPADSTQDGSNGGWQTAGGDHSRNKSRSQPAASMTDSGNVRAYVKNVYQTVNAEELRSTLSKYGELAYFDVSRQKVIFQFPKDI